jgi:hypothetical protein
LMSLLMSYKIQIIDISIIMWDKPGDHGRGVRLAQGNRRIRRVGKAKRAHV